jgi:hypothetical protein
VAAPEAVTRALAVERVGERPHEEPQQQVGHHAQDGEQCHELRRVRDLVGEDGQRHELEPARDAGEAADRPDAAIVGLREQQARVGKVQHGEAWTWLERVGLEV